MFQGKEAPTQAQLMTKSLLWATESLLCWEPLGDRIKRFRVVYHPCPLQPRQELGSCNFYTLTLVHHWLDKMVERGCLGELVFPHFRLQPTSRLDSQRKPRRQQHLRLLQPPHKNSASQAHTCLRRYALGEVSNAWDPWVTKRRPAGLQ